MQVNRPPLASPLAPVHLGAPATQTPLILDVPRNTFDAGYTRPYHSDMRRLVRDAAANKENANPIISERELTADDELAQRQESPTLQDRASTRAPAKRSWHALPAADAPVSECNCRQEMHG